MLVAADQIYGLNALVFFLVVIGLIIGIIWLFGNGPWRRG